MAVRHAEEDDPLAIDLDGMPVVCCTLHSQVAPVCAGIGPSATVAYVQLGGGALPVSLSDTIRELKGRGLLAVAVGAAPCFDGDVQCVGVHSALAWAAASGHDVAVCAIGPGIVGTDSALGHGGLAAADAAQAAVSLGGSPVLAVRYSQSESRTRHRGVSHHARAVLRVAGPGIRVAWPLGLPPPEAVSVEEVDVEGWQEACAGLRLEHMGRGPREDPWFFAAAFAAGSLAARLVASP
jgi:hypothetical protein